MEFEEFANLTNSSTIPDVTPQESRKYMVHEIIFLLFVSIGFCADVTTIYIMLYYKRMRTALNIYIANWAIIDMCTLIVCPSGYELISIIERTSLSGKFMCFLFQASASLHVGLMFAVIIAVFDWLIAAFFPNSYKQKQPYQKFVIGIHWALIIGLCWFLFQSCASMFFIFVSALFLIGAFSLTILLIIIMYLVWSINKCRRKELGHSPLVLLLATAFLFSYILAFLNILLINFLLIYHPLFYMISSCLIFSNSIINFSIMYFAYKDFQLYFRQMIRCSKNRKQEGFSEFDNEDGENHKQNKVQVSFHSHTQEVSTNLC